MQWHNNFLMNLPWNKAAFDKLKNFSDPVITISLLAIAAIMIWTALFGPFLGKAALLAYVLMP